MTSPFSSYLLKDHLQEQVRKLKADIEGLTGPILDSNTDEQIIQHLLSRYTLTAPTILTNQAQQESAMEAMVPVNSILRPYEQGTLITVRVPYEDPCQLITYRPVPLTPYDVEAGLSEGNVIISLPVSN